jgi:hypothetical protein
VARRLRFSGRTPCFQQTTGSPASGPSLNGDRNRDVHNAFTLFTEFEQRRLRVQKPRRLISIPAENYLANSEKQAFRKKIEGIHLYSVAILNKRPKIDCSPRVPLKVASRPERSRPLLGRKSTDLHSLSQIRGKQRAQTIV